MELSGKVCPKTRDIPTKELRPLEAVVSEKGPSRNREKDPPPDRPTRQRSASENTQRVFEGRIKEFWVLLAIE